MSISREEQLIDSPTAWRRLFVSVLLSTIGGIGLWSIVVVLPAIEIEFGIDRGGASLPYFATMLGFAGGGIIMGKLSDRFGIMPPIMLGAFMLSLGYLTSAFSQSLWQFMFAQAMLIGLLGSSATFGPLIADVSFWFRRRRGFAVAIVASGNYLSGAIWPPLMQFGIDNIGWRQTHITIAVVCVSLLIPLARLLKQSTPKPQTRVPSNSRPQLSRDTKTLLKRPPGTQWLLIFAGTACCIAMATPQVHIVAYCFDLGYGANRGAEILSLMLAVGIISRLAFGIIADRIGGLYTLFTSSFLQLITLFFYLPFNGLSSLYFVSMIFGLAQGGIVPSYALVIRDYFPAHEAATRISLVLTATIAGMAIGGWMAGEIFDYAGSYLYAFINGSAWNVLNLLVVSWLLINRLRN
ncbi:MAG: MFS transporter [Rhodospirillaceae bacterium TMED8]|nr:MFS transporter [Magnetovibrio sp.]OUT50911.1 MAG: MFS transporter [Rhodospirillaceae bacterium TMED8]|tara:strand:- start:2871 stop:4094 length:1224 start_codon:yes stop_codon:yes gene_type:complete